MNKQIMIAALALILTARLGTITYNNHRETWYDLPMQRIVERADSIYGLIFISGQIWTYREVVEDLQNVLDESEDEE